MTEAEKEIRPTEKEEKVRRLPFDPKQVAEAQTYSDIIFRRKRGPRSRIDFIGAGSRDLTKAPPKE